MKRLFSRLGRKDPAPQEPSPSTDSAETGTFLTGDGAVDSRNLRLLLDTMAALVSDQVGAEIIPRILDRAIQAVGAERGIMLLERPGGKLEVEVARNDRGQDIDDEFRFSTTVVNQVHESGQGLSLKIGDSGNGTDLSASVVDLKLRAVMCVLLRFQEKTLGVIYVDSRVTSREFSNKDLRFFDALAVALSISLENARLVQEALERQRLQQSLEIAQQIQEELLPDDPQDLEGFDLSGISIPAETAAGDYYDFVRLEDGALGVVVGDVSGHGVGPAMVMTGARASLHILLEESLEEFEILNRVNRQLSRDLADELFMSMLVCKLDPRTRTLGYANAGQCPPLLLRADGQNDKLPGKGLALGIEEEFEYSNAEEVSLGSGDILVAYTDGILEAIADNGEMFGEEGVIRVVRENSSASAKEIIDRLYKAVLSFARGGELDDDLTIVVLKAL